MNAVSASHWWRVLIGSVQEWQRSVRPLRSVNHHTPNDGESSSKWPIPQIPFNFGVFWEGDPMDWLAWVGAGALFLGIAVAIFCDFTILMMSPKSLYVSDVIRQMARDHPVLVFVAGMVCGHLFWTVVKPDK